MKEQYRFVTGDRKILVFEGDRLVREMPVIAGGAEDPPSPDPDPDPTPDPDDHPDPDPDPPNHEAEARKWKALARKHEKQAKANATKATKLDELEEASKTEIQKAADKAALSEKRATEAELKATRFEVAQGKEVPAKLMKFLTGSSKEELEESADELLAAFKDDTSDNGTRPKEKLKPGAAPGGEPEENDPARLAAKIPRDI
jgi:DNA segregation ATPase FtsK/SpoIIIE-like protein